MGAVHSALLTGGPHVSIGVNKASALALGADLDALDGAGMIALHVDVMDGVFCPGPITGGPALVHAVAGRCVTDVHLMIERPLDHVEAYVAAGADILSFQVEAARQPLRVLQVLGEHDVVRGVAVSPSSPLCLLEPLLDELEYILLVTINPGWGGQTMIGGYARRLAEARAMTAGRNVVIGIDGGITRENVAQVAACRPDLIITGSAVFADGEPGRGARAMCAAVAGAA